MTNLLLILVLIFGGVAFIAWALERFGGEPDPAQVQRLGRWIMPLLVITAVIGALQYFLGG
ncbi:hypothetical protein E4634_07785 [Mangrovimicrobium sediminis]|uniref:Uncharacterized protein n=1 Tax=Mangrovimicrobium sediminis TaxID=2562682 RepID=A0A4Z0M3K7_9GAMM|nr:hypothetical protein [Haliea sp. SAOS-164]TGD74030.1 hypothetical protein E4634_07785 [Haliea sp. SAOS-164]